LEISAIYGVRSGSISLSHLSTIGIHLGGISFGDLAYCSSWWPQIGITEIRNRMKANSWTYCISSEFRAQYIHDQILRFCQHTLRLLNQTRSFSMALYYPVVMDLDRLSSSWCKYPTNVPSTHQ